MIHFFRRFFQSKVGLGITFAFLALIAFAFASSDVANTGTFGGVAGGNRVAVVGDTKIGTADLSRAATSAVNQMRQENPTMSIQAFVQQGGLEEVLDSLINRTAIREYAQKYGLRAGANLINSEIIGIPAFRGPDGNFSQTAYQNALAQQGLSDAVVREDIASSLYAQQLLVPASYAATMPEPMARRYAALLRERRQGAIATLPSAAYAPKGDPTAAQLQAFYQSNRSDFIRPERRVIRYATFGTDALDGSIEPTDNEIAARYERDKAQYAASETRTLTQIIVPTEAGANALRQQLAGGASIDQVARSAGFSTAQIGPIGKAAYQQQSSKPVADAVFGAAGGSVAPIARSGLGYHVVKVDSVARTGQRSLADARSEIAESVRAEKRRAAISDLSARVEEEIDQGIALSDMAKQLGAKIETTRPLTGDGRVYGATDETAPEILAPALGTAFQMQEGEPQLAEVVPGQTFLIYEVSEITESAAAPLAEIREQVVNRWRTKEGSTRARAAADRVLARLREGKTLAAAVAAEKVTVPGVDQVDFNREQLTQMFQGRVPSPLALMFSMAQGTAKKLQAPGANGWFVVDLDKISAEPLATDDPLIARARAELSQAVGAEYAEQLGIAMRKEIGAERNADAIEAVRKQLAGES